MAIGAQRYDLAEEYDVEVAAFGCHQIHRPWASNRGPATQNQLRTFSFRPAHSVVSKP
jgi:hypothetical protein